MRQGPFKNKLHPSLALFYLTSLSQSTSTTFSFTPLPQLINSHMGWLYIVVRSHLSPNYNNVSVPSITMSYLKKKSANKTNILK